MSKFWTAVLQHLRIQSSPSTAFHPQYDRQVECVNALLEDYLQQFVNNDQDDWSRWLPIAEFSYNNTPSSSTKLTPCSAQQGFHPRFNSLIASSGIPALDGFVHHLQQVQSSLKDVLVKAKESQAQFYNKGRRVAVTYQLGDLVWLSRRHIKTRRPASKLDVRCLGPFPVVRMVGDNAAELSLPREYSRIHPVFNVSLLMPYVARLEGVVSPGSHNTPPFEVAFSDWILARFILNYKCTQDGVHQYLIRDEELSGLNDEWRLLTTLSPNLDPFLQAFHLRSPQLGSGPPQAVWSQHSLLMV